MCIFWLYYELICDEWGVYILNKDKIGRVSCLVGYVIVGFYGKKWLGV